MTETAVRNRLVKKSLLRYFKPSDVSVVGGRGTAYGWVEIKVEQDRPNNCACNWITETRTWGGKEHTMTYRGQIADYQNRQSHLCDACLAKYQDAQNKIKKAIFNKKIEYTHYYADDGYNTRHAEVLYDVEIR